MKHNLEFLMIEMFQLGQHQEDWYAMSVEAIAQPALQGEVVLAIGLQPLAALKLQHLYGFQPIVMLLAPESKEAVNELANIFGEGIGEMEDSDMAHFEILRSSYGYLFTNIVELTSDLEEVKRNISAQIAAELERKELWCPVSQMNDDDEEGEIQEENGTVPSEQHQDSMSYEDNENQTEIFLSRESDSSFGVGLRTVLNRCSVAWVHAHGISS